MPEYFSSLLSTINLIEGNGKMRSQPTWTNEQGFSMPNLIQAAEKLYALIAKLLDPAIKE